MLNVVEFSSTNNTESNSEVCAMSSEWILFRFFSCFFLGLLKLESHHEKKIAKILPLAQEDAVYFAMLQE